MFRGLLAPDLDLIIDSNSLLKSQGATVSNNPIFSGFSPTFLIGLYRSIRASPIKSSSSVIFFLLVIA